MQPQCQPKSQNWNFCDWNSRFVDKEKGKFRWIEWQQEIKPCCIWSPRLPPLLQVWYIFSGKSRVKSKHWFTFSISPEVRHQQVWIQELSNSWAAIFLSRGDADPSVTQTGYWLVFPPRLGPAKWAGASRYPRPSTTSSFPDVDQLMCAFGRAKGGGARWRYSSNTPE